MAFIPDSLIFEFLIRLPVKSLARFKCIDRSWSSLISDPDFVYAHLKRAKTENHCGLLLSFISHDNLSTTINLFTINDYGLAVLNYSVQVCLDSYCILPSCNGLVCFYGVRGGIHICNPATKNMVKLPGNGAKGSRLLSCGFGFDRQACTSKVIMISEPSSSADDPNIEIFTMGTRSWRTVKYHERFRFLNRQPPVFASGFFYWIIANNDSSGFLIASFDIGSETFEVIHPPESVSRKDWHMLCIGELGGDLCMMDIDFELEGRRRMDLWLLKEVSGKSSGHEKKQRWIQESIVHPSEPLDATRPVALNHERSEILLHGFLKGSDSLMNWYNLETQSFREQDMKEITSPYFHVSTYVESFVPLNV
ncbi:putative F-box protein At2g02030 [Pistacia vera]|uniref:putative F-box protein At2g02030 n=1 Tax=Pistacia vera TaxID=55513 RepID=UPI0012639C58|nr:putative F-box protein At2g02030 [Pistacia vera]